MPAQRVRTGEGPCALAALALLACHTPNAWTPLREDLDFDHDRDTPFALTGRHEQANCRGCHLDLRFDQPDVAPDACASCHLDVHRGQLGADCQQCHSTQDFHLVKATEVHARTGFPLTGTHLQLACEACHAESIDGAFAPLPTECFACHAADYEATTNSLVNHVAAGFPTNCDACHGTLTFTTGAGFDHASVSGGFSLVGAHSLLQCSACHAVPSLDPLWDPTSQEDCFTCHQDDFQAAPGHVASGFPTTCQTCHSTTSFQGATVDHAALSGGFVLVGAHLTLPCAACHSEGDFGVPFDPANQEDCYACHASDYQSAPGHDEANFPTTCQTCHSTVTFEGASFDHQAITGFPLLGAHATVPCTACHSGPDFEPTWNPSSAEDCFTCHAEDHQAAHPSFPTTCQTCHNTTSFQGATFDHAANTGFPLIGVHDAIDCSSCHTGPDFQPIWNPSSPDDCFTCHAEDYQNAPGHVASSFPTTCQTCHPTTAWEDATFDHAAITGFPLVGTHNALPCTACHAGPDFEPIWNPSSSEDCYTCHQDDYQNAPGHVASNFPTTCQTCHPTTTWGDATFDHQAITGFPLLGAHNALPCTACHAGPDFEPIWNPASAEDCYTCHVDEYQNAPGHASAPFPTTCTTCHSTVSWEGASFDHQAATGFPLLGAHNTLECTACHRMPDFEPIWNPSSAEDCYTCHQDDYTREHPNPTFPTTCLECHTTSTFGNPTFDHQARTGFPLVGAHAVLACASCHTVPDYQPTYNPAGPEDCYTCHQDDYQNAPGHASAPFPTTCLTCHSTSSWEGASFDHAAQTGFPLVGAHQTLQCTACHRMPDFEPIWNPSGPDDCYTCHLDEYQTAPGHDEAPFPTTCATCHNTNTWEGASFDHQAVTGFPLIGAHVSLPCSACHVGPDFEPIWNPSSAEDCYTCHQDDYTREHTGTGFPTTCLTCHNTNTWQGAQFNHDPFFPIYSGRHQGVWNSCQDCHTQPGNFQVFSCFACHPRGEMDDEHEDVGGYVYESNACYNCHPDGEERNALR
ncbi:MAG TPA: hypothetical protein VD962_13115 [Rubricoccaceae bacterium]|nr:hypothetical protein [Rubricoccaceae bacterium]